MDPEYFPEQYMERLREANAAIIEFEHLIASREEELRAAREEIADLRERLAHVHVQEPSDPAQAVTQESFAELRDTLEEIITVAVDLRAEITSLLPPGVLERLDGLIHRARAACEKLS